MIDKFKVKEGLFAAICNWDDVHMVLTYQVYLILRESRKDYIDDSDVYRDIVLYHPVTEVRKISHIRTLETAKEIMCERLRKYGSFTTTESMRTYYWKEQQIAVDMYIAVDREHYLIIDGKPTRDALCVTFYEDDKEWVGTNMHKQYTAKGEILKF